MNQDVALDIGQLLHFFAEESRDVFWIKSADSQRQIYVSRAYEQIWGRTCQSLYAHPEQWLEFLYPEDRERLCVTINKCHENICPDEKCSEQYRIIRPDGAVRWIDDHSVPIFHGKTLIAFAGIARDITFNVTLREAKERLFYSIIDVIPVSIYWKDSNRRYLGCNKYMLDMAGLSQLVDIIGKQDSQLAWREYADELAEIDNKVILNKETIEVEETPRLANQQKRVFLTAKTPLLSGDGEVAGLIGVSFDITKHKETEKALKDALQRAQAADQAKASFIRDIEHDIRTPFCGVYSVAQLLAAEAHQEPTRSLARTMVDCAAELLDYCNRIIEYSRVESGMAPLVDRKFDLKKLAERVLAMEKPAAISKGLAIQFTYDSQLPRLFIGDEYGIQRILLNLLSNAIKFTQEGYVALDIQQIKQTKDSMYVLSLTVADTGIGIPQEKQQAIFERFTRLSPANQGCYKGIGLGLGLANVKRLLHSLAGELELDSTPGKGSCFTCFLPLKVSLLDDRV